MSQSLDGERSVSDVTRGKKPWFTPARKAGAIAISAAVVVGFIFWKDPGRKKEDPEPPAPASGIGQTVTYEPPKPVAMPVVTAPPAAAVLPQPAPSPPPSEPLPQPQRSVLAQLPEMAKPRIPRMLSYSTTEPGEEAATRAAGAAPTKAAGTELVYKGSDIIGAKAGPAMDRDLLLMPGIIRCILDTGINSTIPGPLMCHLERQ